VTRWAMVSIVGFISFVLGLTGYGFALGFIVSAVMKPIFPDHVGLWTDHGVTLGIRETAQQGDLLGWWIIPIGLILGTIFLIATTRLLRWMLRFAKSRRPSLLAA
jgi:hypothetical protein